MQRFPQVLKNLLSLLSGGILFQIGSSAAAILLARYLGVTQYGEYATAVAYALAFSVLIDLGISTILVRTISVEPQKAGVWFGNAVVIRGLVALVIYGVMNVVAKMLGYPPTTVALIRWSGIYAICLSGLQLLFALLQSFRRMEVQGLQQAIAGLVLLFGTVLLIQARQPASAFMLMLVVVYAVSVSGVMLYTLRLVKPRIDWRLMGSIVRGSSWLYAGDLVATMILQLNKIILSVMVGTRAVGIFSPAIGLIFATYMFSSPVLYALQPSFFESAAINRTRLGNIYRTALRFLAASSILITIGTAVMAGPIINLLYGAEFKESAWILVVLSPMISFHSLNSIVGPMLIALKRERLRLIILAVNAVLFIILSVLLISFASYTGAAIAATVSEILQFAMYYFAVRPSVPSVGIWEIIRKPLAVGLVTGLVAVQLSQWSIVVASVALVLVYVGGLWVVRFLEAGDLDYLRSLKVPRVCTKNQRLA